MSRTCKLEGCAIDELGTCALEQDPATCKNRIGIVAAEVTPTAGPVEPGMPDFGAPVLEQPTRSVPFPSSRPLGPDGLNRMMGKQYVNLIGILGDPESGKTACLASLYLLVSNAALNGWKFADSKSLMAFEDIARGARDWNNGTPPDQMTVHTEMSDDYKPGFLHLRLKREADGKRFDLALPDLPGEWTQALVSSARTDRFEFLKSAEAIWMFADGRTLADRAKRSALIFDLGQLARRLMTFLGDHKPRLLIVVTHHDRHPLDAAVQQRITNELAKCGASAQIMPVAPFSDAPEEVPSGHGLSQLVDASVGLSSENPIFWASSPPKDGDRAFLRHRRDR